MNCNAYHIFFSNLSNPLKIKIIVSLKQSSKNVTQLIKELKIEQSKLSHALANLRFCKIVKSKQQGKNRIYSLNKSTIIPILKIIDKHKQNYCSGCRK